MSMIQTAIQRMQSGQWKAAITILNEVPPSFQSYNLLGIAHQMSQNWSGAKTAWAQALRCNPDSEDVRLNLGIACVATGEQAEAEVHWLHILKSNPHHVQSLINLGLLYREAQRNQEAHDCWQRALDAIPDQPKIIEWLADVKGVLGKEAMTLGRVNEAGVLLQKAVSMDPIYGMLWGYLSEWHLQKEEFSEALQACTKACELEPNNPSFFEMRGSIHRRMGNSETALQMYRMAIDLGTEEESTLKMVAELEGENKG